MPPVRVLVRSVGVGAAATLVDLIVLAALATGLALGPRVASPFALASGLTVQFVGAKLFAFEDRRPRWGRQAAQFAAVEALAFGANAILFDTAVRVAPFVPYVAARLVVQAAVYWCVCLPLWARIFERREASA